MASGGSFRPLKKLCPLPSICLMKCLWENDLIKIFKFFHSMRPSRQFIALLSHCVWQLVNYVWLWLDVYCKLWFQMGEFLRFYLSLVKCALETAMFCPFGCVGCTQQRLNLQSSFQFFWFMGWLLWWVVAFLQALRGFWLVELEYRFVYWK